MFLKKAFFACIALVLLASCLENKNVSVSSSVPMETDDDILGDDGQSDPPRQLSLEEAKQVVYENEELIQIYHLEIDFISKANFGMPGGDNWIVRLNDGHIIIYAISGDKIVRQFYSDSYDIRKNNDIDFMRDIPGTHIGGSLSSFGDFNADGVDEIFSYWYLGMGAEIGIVAYSTEKDDLIYLTNNLPFTSRDSYYNPVVPVQFMTYKGMYGFKAYLFYTEVAGGPGWEPEPDPRNNRWFFYTWDTQQKQYVEVGEVVDEENGSEDTSEDS